MWRVIWKVLFLRERLLASTRLDCCLPFLSFLIDFSSIHSLLTNEHHSGINSCQRKGGNEIQYWSFIDGTAQASYPYWIWWWTWVGKQCNVTDALRTMLSVCTRSRCALSCLWSIIICLCSREIEKKESHSGSGLYLHINLWILCLLSIKWKYVWRSNVWLYSHTVDCWFFYNISATYVHWCIAIFFHPLIATDSQLPHLPIVVYYSKSV